MSFLEISVKAIGTLSVTRTADTTISFNTTSLLFSCAQRAEVVAAVAARQTKVRVIRIIINYVYE